MIRERVKAGLERARAQGKTLGRPTISTATETAIRKALKKGDVGIRKIATEIMTSPQPPIGPATQLPTPRHRRIVRPALRWW